jgi:rhodanese-related sulfurtransferase
MAAAPTRTQASTSRPVRGGVGATGGQDAGIGAGVRAGRAGRAAPVAGPPGDGVGDGCAGPADDGPGAAAGPAAEGGLRGGAAGIAAGVGRRTAAGIAAGVGRRGASGRGATGGAAAVAPGGAAVFSADGFACDGLGGASGFAGAAPGAGTGVLAHAAVGAGRAAAAGAAGTSGAPGAGDATMPSGPGAVSTAGAGTYGLPSRSAFQRSYSSREAKCGIGTLRASDDPMVPRVNEGDHSPRRARAVGSAAVCARLVLLAGALLLTGCDGALPSALGAHLIEPASVAALGGVEVIDLQDPTEFAAGHLPGSVRVPILGLAGHLARAPARSWQTVLLVCTDAKLAVFAAPTARLYRADVRVLAGGRDAWRAAGLPVETGPAAAVADDGLPFQRLSRVEQLVACASGCVVKPLYLALSFLLLRLLRRAPAPGLRLLRLGLVGFFLGEVMCAVNFFWHRPGLVFPVDLLHGAGMVAMSALVPWGLWRLLDERVLHLDDPAQGCAVQRLCGRCWKRDPVRCGLHDLMIPVVIGLAVVALMPLTAPLRPAMFRADVLGTVTDFGEPVVNQLVELRLYPVAAAALSLATLPLVLRARPGALRRVEPLFFAAVGLAAYPVLRHLLANAYRESLPWADLWEELTELLAVATLGFFLVRFRAALGLGAERARSPAPAS